MQSMPVFPDILKIANKKKKNADVSRTQGVSRGLCIFWIFFRSDITVPSFINVGCVTDFGEGGPEKAHPE